MESVIEKMVRELEAQAGSSKGEKARALKVSLDDLLLVLTEASRDVCSNTKCPHYNKKCRMR